MKHRKDQIKKKTWCTGRWGWGAVGGGRGEEREGLDVVMWERKREEKDSKLCVHCLYMFHLVCMSAVFDILAQWMN